MRVLVLLLLSIVWISGCSNTQKVTSRELGDAWPLVVSEGRVGCEQDGALYFSYHGTKYALNTQALKVKHYLYIESLRKKVPPPKRSKIALTALINVAKEQCTN